MNAPESSHKLKASFKWDDPFLLDDQLSPDERMVRDAAQAYAQSKLAPRVLEAFRHEKTDPSIFREMGELGVLGCYVADRVRRARAELRLLWLDRARDREGRFRVSVDDERAELAGDAPDLSSSAPKRSEKNICRSWPPENGSAASG